jgi:hypothetical protein
VDKIITCSRCQARLTTADVHCSQCGTLNTWVHPELQTMLHYIHSGLDVPDKYQYRLEGPLLMVTALRRPRFLYARRGLWLLLLSVLIALSAAWGRQHFVWFSVLLLGCSSALALNMTSRSREKWLLLDYLQDRPVWRSNDEYYFARVLAKLNLVPFGHGDHPFPR